MKRLMILVPSLIVLAVSLTLAPSMRGQDPSEDAKLREEMEKFLAGLEPSMGPVVSDVGSMAFIKLTEGYRSFGPASAQTILKKFGNRPSSAQVALVSPKTSLDWFIVFTWDPCGYVSDEDKNIDSDALLKGMQDSEPEDNKRRAAEGLSPHHIAGWAIKPRYDSETKTLEWASILESDGHQTINFNTKRLGRKGVMEIILVCDPPDLEATLPTFREVIKGFSYRSEDAYASYRKGDKIAQYTLTGLVAGGAIAVAAKLGFLTKFWKLIAVGFAAVVGFFAKIFKRKKSTPEAQG